MNQISIKYSGETCSEMHVVIRGKTMRCDRCGKILENIIRYIGNLDFSVCVFGGWMFGGEWTGSLHPPHRSRVVNSVLGSPLNQFPGPLFIPYCCNCVFMSPCSITTVHDDRVWKLHLLGPLCSASWQQWLSQLAGLHFSLLLVIGFPLAMVWKWKCSGTYGPWGGRWPWVLSWLFLSFHCHSL